MAGFSVNDTVALMMKVLSNHQEIIKVWHDVSALLQRLGLLPQGATPAKATHNFDMKWVQSSLNKQIKGNIKVDGVEGPATQEATRIYQGMRGLPQDGWLGPVTLAQLDKDMQ